MAKSFVLRVSTVKRPVVLVILLKSFLLFRRVTGEFEGKGMVIILWRLSSFGNLGAVGGAIFHCDIFANLNQGEKKPCTFFWDLIIFFLLYLEPLPYPAELEVGGCRPWTSTHSQDVLHDRSTHIEYADLS